MTIDHRDQDEILDDLGTLAEETVASRSLYLAARQERDEAIREAIASKKVSMYAIAKRTALSEQAVAKIRDRA